MINAFVDFLFTLRKCMVQNAEKLEVRFEDMSWHLPGAAVENDENCCPDQDLKPALPEYETTFKIQIYNFILVGVREFRH
jgi:hypothetical protein